MSTTYGWDAINKPNTVKGDPVDLIDQYALISLEDLTKETESYVDTHSRNAQNSIQMYTCIMASLSEEGRKKVTNLQGKYTVLGIKSGPLLYKIVTQKVVVDNRSTITHLCQSLMNLDTYMTSCGTNIEVSNRYVQSLRWGRGSPIFMSSGRPNMTTYGNIHDYEVTI